MPKISQKPLTSEESVLLSEWRKEFNDEWSKTSEQRDNCNEDIRFVTTPAAQWEGFLREQFANRPRYQFDETSQEVNRFYGEWLTNRSEVRYRPETGTDQSEAKTLNGLYRRDKEKDDGQFSIDHMILEGIQGGFGGMKLLTELEDEDEDDNRQFVKFDPIVSAHSMIVFGPSKRYDKSDAPWCYILSEIDRDQAKKEHGKDITSFTQPNDRREFNWNSGGSSVFIAERYEKKKIKTKILTYRNEATGEEKDYLLTHLEKAGVLDDLETQGFEKVSERKKTIRVIEKSIFSGDTMIEEPRTIPGKHIPVIPFYAYWTFTDGQEYYYGMVRKMKDPQRLLNMQVSTLAEVAATSVKQVPIFTPDQMAGHQTNWSQAHLGKKNYQQVNPQKDELGKIIAMGPVGLVSPPVVDPALAAMIEVTRGYMQSQTGGAPQDVNDPDASGKAILAVQQRVDMNTQSIMENIQRTLRRIGTVYESIASDINDTVQDVTLIGEDGTDFNTTLNKMVLDKETGEMKQINSISEGRFSVIVDTGPAYASRRQQTVEEIRELMAVLPEGSQYTGPLLGSLIENIDGVGLSDLKEFNKRLMLVQGLRDPENEEEEQLLANLQQQQQEQEGQQDMTQLLIQATAMQAQAEAQERQSKARNNEADTRKKLSETKLNLAKVAQTGQSISNDKLDNLVKVVTPVQQQRQAQ